MLQYIQRAITLRHEKNFRQARLGETKLKGGVLNGKKESKKGGAQGKKGGAQSKEGGKAPTLNFSPAPILQLRLFRQIFFMAITYAWITVKPIGKIGAGLLYSPFDSLAEYAIVIIQARRGFFKTKKTR